MLKRLLGSPEGLLVCSFALVILAGTVALRLPISHGDRTVGWLDACFISTSAVCVTGLATVDPATAFSRFGQIVIMVLIQIGGLGILTFSALAAQMLAFRVSFGSHALLQDVFFQSEQRGSLRRSLAAILLLTFGIELCGAILIFVGMLQYDRPPGGVFEAVFLAVSAFCNAGFSVYSDNVMSFRDSPLILGVIMAMIVLGGLGYTVLIECGQRIAAPRERGAGRPVRWSLNSRVVLLMSGLLVFGGAAAIAATGLTRAETSVYDYLLHSLFQSVTSRTAGFNSVDIGALPSATLLLIIALMFVGGSPGSCAGGIKTTTVAVWSADVRAHLDGKREVVLMGRRLPADVVRRAGMVFGLAATWVAVGALLLTMSERVGHGGNRFEDVLFEQVSAFGTVGLSTGLTPRLSELGKVWIIASMFVGRVGPLTVALLVVRSEKPSPFNYPSERVMIG